jgi:hypothetical protein
VNSWIRANGIMNRECRFAYYCQDHLCKVTLLGAKNGAEKRPPNVCCMRTSRAPTLSKYQVETVRTKSIHRMFSMIAMHIDGKVFAVIPSAYSALINLLLPELDVMASTSVNLAVGEFPTHVSPADAKAWPARQALLIARLKQRIAEFGDRLTFSVQGRGSPCFCLGFWKGTDEAIWANSHFR